MKNKPTYKELEKQIEILKLKSAKQKVDKAFHAGELVIANKEKVKRAKERTLELQKQNKEYASLNEEYLTQNEEIKTTNEELRETIERVEESEEKLHIKDFAFQSSLSADSIGNNEGFLTHANPAFARIWGYDNVNELIGKPIIDFLANKDDAIEIVESISNTGKWKGEYKALKKDGTTFIALSFANAVYDKEGNKTALYSSVYDITNQKQAEEKLQQKHEEYTSLNEEYLAQNEELKSTNEELRETIERVEESEENFRGVYEQSPIAIEIYNKEGKLIEVNKKTLEIFGVDDFKYVKDFNLFSDPNLSSEETMKLKKGETIFISTDFDFELVKANNLYPTSRSGKMYMNMYAIPLINDNKVSGFLVQIIETTKRKLAEEKLKQKTDNLEALNEEYASINEELKSNNEELVISKEKIEESEKRFQQIVETTGEWIWEVDSKGLYTFVSPRSISLLDYKPEEIIGKKHFYDFFLPNEKEELKMLLWRLSQRKSLSMILKI